MKLKSILLLFLTIGIIFSCKKEKKNVEDKIPQKEIYKPRTIKSINLKKFDYKAFGGDKLNSIRAIEVTDSITYFIAQGGKIYGFFNRGDFLVTPNNFFGNIAPDFRAAAHTKKHLYALSIANPAYLYQIKMDETEGLKEPKLVYTEKGETVFYDAMAFFDEQNGIAIGDPTKDCLSILLTNDAGNSWQKVACNNLPKLIKGEAAFAASNTNISIIGNQAWVITGGLQSRVLHTIDKGKTWNIYNTPLIDGKESTGAYTLAFNDSKNGIICGGDYTNKNGNQANKAITKDGGKTWQLAANGKEPGYISCVQYVPNTDGKELFAVSTEGIYFSNNSGHSWLKVNDEGYFAIKFVNKNNAWLAGNGKIAKMILE
jgi:hypothetical protein